MSYKHNKKSNNTHLFDVKIILLIKKLQQSLRHAKNNKKINKFRK
jgi:hypothetical protein